MTFKDRSRGLPRKQEDRLAGLLRGKRQVASGATPHAKGDVISADEIVDAKTTERSFSLNFGVLTKLVSDARKHARLPILQVEVRAMPEGKRDWVVLPLDYYLQLTGRDE